MQLLASFAHLRGQGGLVCYLLYLFYFFGPLTRRGDYEGQFNQELDISPNV